MTEGMITKEQGWLPVWESPRELKRQEQESDQSFAQLTDDEVAALWHEEEQKLRDYWNSIADMYID